MFKHNEWGNIYLFVPDFSRQYWNVTSTPSSTRKRGICKTRQQSNVCTFAVPWRNPGEQKKYSKMDSQRKVKEIICTHTHTHTHTHAHRCAQQTHFRRNRASTFTWHSERLQILVMESMVEACTSHDILPKQRNFLLWVVFVHLRKLPFPFQPQRLFGLVGSRKFVKVSLTPEWSRVLCSQQFGKLIIALVAVGDPQVVAEKKRTRCGAGDEFDSICVSFCAAAGVRVCCQCVRLSYGLGQVSETNLPLSHGFSVNLLNTFLSCTQTPGRLHKPDIGEEESASCEEIVVFDANQAKPLYLLEYAATAAS